MLKPKSFIAVLVAILCLPLLATAQSETLIFNDVSVSTPNSSSIETLKDDGVVHGYPDGTFKPGFTINRAEFATLITNILDIETKGENCFTDVSNQWFAAPVCTLKEKGIINGYGDGSFQPGRNINLVEAATIIAKANNLPQQTGGSWFEPAIKALESKGAIPVSIDTLDQKLSRSEVAEMMYRIDKNEDQRTSKTFVSLNSQMPSLASCEELEEKISNFQYTNNARYLLPTEGAVDTVTSENTAGSSMDSAANEKSVSSDDYSGTNLQVENVDESDVMKNNGSHIFFIQGQNVKVVKAFPVNEMKEEANIFVEESFTPQSLYLDGNTLVILGGGYDRSNGSVTKVFVYDISNPAEPKQTRKLQFTGQEISSRKINNNLYLVLNKYQPYNYYNARYKLDFAAEADEAPITSVEDSLPTYSDSLTGTTEKLANCSDIIYFPRPQTMNYLIVAGIPLSGNDTQVSKKVILGTSENVYASSDNLYVANTSYQYPEYSIYDSWDRSSNTYSYNQTNVYRFALNNGKVEYKDKGSVSGRIINQFAMDEHNNGFRIATTSDGTTTSNNNLYILNRNNLGETLGKIENIAPGEVIYSTRFVGNRAYMVTFKTTDPLFVIDTTDASNPKILGKLKIPGYSNYLHPFDENHLIGLGKEAVEDKNGSFAWYQGMKLALYDVSIVSNPVEVSSVEIGDRGTESEALHNHKAILFSKEKGFIAFPITIAQKPSNNTDTSAYGEFIFQGAQVYNINIASGISLRGAISHYAENAEEYLKSGSYWWNFPKDIKRILYIGDNFYTVSDGMIKASDINTVKEKNSIELEVTNQYQYDDGQVY